MANGYEPKDIERKWQEQWETQGIYHATDGKPSKKDEKFYGLIEFPYPSGEGLHVGHPRSYTAIDIVTRKKRMEGKNVLYPIGWDAFGLPTENFAIKHKVKPQDATKKNIATFTRQLKSLGFGFDWSREINTTDPSYYRWTQWMFLKFYGSWYDAKKGTARPIDELPIPKNVGAGLTPPMREKAIQAYLDAHRLAFKASATINWCAACTIGLSNEEAQAGVCERCGGTVEKREKEQWMIRITAYAERLLEDLKTVDYLEKIKTQQINWIGRSEGASVDFAVEGNDADGKAIDADITVFTTRPDTLFGATYLVLSPEHPFVDTWLEDGAVSNAKAVQTYREEARRKSDLERQENKEKTGVELKGIRALNPATGEHIPVWISDYVLASYGTGAIMAVPAHDDRDFAFATKFRLPIRNVVDPVFVRSDVVGRKTFETKNKIVAIVEDGKGSVLTIHWPPELGGRLFLGGTLKEGESPEQAALRELAEETGYTDAETLAVSEEAFDYKYFAYSKSVANQAFTRFVHLHLRSLKKEAQRLEKDEVGKFIVEWVPFMQAKTEVIEPLHVYGFEKFIEGRCFTGEGVAARSGFLDGVPTKDAAAKMIAWLEKKKMGRGAVTYKLRDWVFSRQRYWGEPIPIVFCDECGAVPVPEDQLPVVLPDVEKYEPTDTGESPLAKIKEWVNVKCPHCGGPARRETDTMPNWAGSSWYFLRYCDPHNDTAFADPKKLEYWMPVDLYNGGMEHTTLHLLYSRFWYKFLWDLGLVPKKCGPEPYAKRRSHALILGEGGVKMSKSKGNVVNPDDVVAVYGADVFRMYEMFIGPFDADAPWDTRGIEGVKRFIDKVWRMFVGAGSPRPGAETAPLQEGIETLLNQTIKKVGEDIETLNFNTAVSAMMILANAMSDADSVPTAAAEAFLKILAPFAPHVTEELWHQMGHTTSIHLEPWPTYDPKKTVSATFELVVQVNGKVRDRLTVATDIGEEDAKTQALASEKVKPYLDGKPPKKVVYVKGRLVSISV